MSDRWVPVRAQFSPAAKLVRGLVNLLLPTCIPELLALSLLLPISPMIPLVLLVIPLTILFVVVLPTTPNSAWRLAQARLGDGRLELRIPCKELIQLPLDSVYGIDSKVLVARSWIGSVKLICSSQDDLKRLLPYQSHSTKVDGINWSQFRA